MFLKNFLKDFQNYREVLPNILLIVFKISTNISHNSLGLNAAKNTDYLKKGFKQKLFIIKYPKKNSVDAYL